LPIESPLFLAEISSVVVQACSSSQDLAQGSTSPWNGCHPREQRYSNQNHYIFQLLLIPLKFPRTRLKSNGTARLTDRMTSEEKPQVNLLKQNISVLLNPNFSSGQIKIITETVQDCIQNAELLEAVGQELVYSLPFTMAQRNSALPTLQNLLDVLDKQGQSIGINSYGISDTSLEEIFLKIAHCEEYNKEQAKPNGIVIQMAC